MIYLKLFWEFFKVGLFAIGGGMATVPFLIRMSAKTGWFTVDELANMIAVSESTPGPIGVNMATYVGFTTCGYFGGLFSTFGLVLPSLIVILIVAKFLSKFRNNPIVDTTFSAIRPAVVGLIGYAMWTVATIALFDGKSLLPVNTVAFVLLFAAQLKFKKVHPIIWIFVGAVFGILFL